MRSSGVSEQRKVLHVARADLNHVSVLLNQIDTGFVKRFRDNLQAVRLTDFRQNLQSFFAEPLKRIWRGSGLERAAAKEARTTATHRFSNGECLRVTLDCARPGDNR